MIPSGDGQSFCERCIPRESGDDPSNTPTFFQLGAYSPRERG